MELLKLLSLNEVVAQIISFFVVLWLLRVFLWKRLLRLLDDRKERIAKELQDIEEAKVQTQRLKDEYQALISNIDQESKKRIAQAIIKARQTGDDIRKKAYAEAQGIIENSRANMKYELAKAKESVKEELIDLTIRAAEHIIEEKLTSGQDRKVVEEFLERIDEAV